MKQAIWLLTAVIAAFFSVDQLAGSRAAQSMGLGAIALMSGTIALTFLWLWWERATPLALGMAVSWAGTASMMGWYVQRPLGIVETMGGDAVPLVFLALQITGALLHFEVMQTSMGFRRGSAALPALVAFAASAAAVHITKM